SLKDKWNILTNPVDQTYVRGVDTLYPNAISQAYRFDQVLGYQPVSAIDNGMGVWLKFPGPKPNDIFGVPMYNVTIPVSTGWNLVGGPAGPVDVSTIQQDPSDIVTSNYYIYQNGYIAASTIPMAKGFWVKVNQNGTLTLSSTSSEPRVSKSSSSIDELEELSSFTLSDVSGYQQTLYFGQRIQSKSMSVSFEMPPPAPAGFFDARFATQTMAELIGSGEGREVPILISGAAYPVTVKWNVKDGSIAALRIDGSETSMSGTGSISIPRSASSIKLSFVAGSKEGLPTEYALYQNYPNPFNPTTTIRFDLPEVSTVTLKIYNILGQEVATLLNNQAMDAGRHSIEFDAGALAGGVYIYRIESGSFNDAKAMMLLK
ncbi:MAG: T9SS type A sorting domain-containing protein, partial [Ignavibacteriae bacterium]|nr:T9SS type A sorting domain-containing protein [Ignavibacteriota bacterium]